MATVEGARRIRRIGGLVATFGGGIGLAVWLFAFSGDLSRPSIFFLWPIGLGSVIALVGVVLERFAKQSDVGRQLRQP